MSAAYELFVRGRFVGWESETGRGESRQSLLAVTLWFNLPYVMASGGLTSSSIHEPANCQTFRSPNSIHWSGDSAVCAVWTLNLMLIKQKASVAAVLSAVRERSLAFFQARDSLAFAPTPTCASLRFENSRDRAHSQVFRRLLAE